jgi:transmembrane sensor
MNIDEQHFKRLLDAYLRGHATPDEKKLLDDFFETYPQLSRASADADSTAREALWRQLAARMPAQAPAGKERRLPTFWYAVAAALTVFALSWFLIVRYTRETAVPVVAQLRQAVTDRGQKLKIELLDGTQVTLNANSKLEFPERFAGDTREVYLTGEAYFQVAHDAAHPFIVHTAVANTLVLGTSFNVKLIDNRTEVTLVEGKVDVGGVILKPNQQAIARSGGQPVEVRDIDVTAFVDWKDNILRFDNMPLGEAVTVLQDWYGVDITLEDPALAACTISATYRKETLKNVLTSVSYMLKLTYQQDGNKIVLQGRGCNPQ